MLGQIGGDTEGEGYLKYLKENNVDADQIEIKKD